MHFEQQQQLPPLIPIKKKKDIQSSYTPQTDDKSKHMQSTQPKTQQRQDNNLGQAQKTPQPALTNRNNYTQQKDASKIPKQFQQKKVQSFSQKFKNIQEQSATQKKSTTKKSQEQKKQQNEKSKFLIAEMLNKISVKNISEELYPITNQTIETVINQMEDQIKAYKMQAQKKQNTLVTNPNNQHLKIQIANLQKSINHCATIKQLYHQKINFRNKIAILQGKIIELRAENRDLKIKVSRGIQKIQNHMHNLPCQKQKELREELNKTTEEFKKEKEMRMSLQNNIQDIIMNFKRLYEQADVARLIVTKKLKDIEDREKKINEARLQLAMDGDQQTSNSIKRSPKLEQLDEKRSPKPPQANIHQSENSTQRYRQPYPRAERDGRQRDRQRTERQLQKTPLQRKQLEQKKPMSFQESIRKMRGNQSMFSKVNNRS